MPKVPLVLLVIFAVIVGLWIFKERHAHPTQPHAQTTSVHNSKPLKQIEKTKHNTSIKPQKVKESQKSAKKAYSNEKKTLYESLSIEEAKLTTPPRKHVTPVGAMQIIEDISKHKLGDTLLLPNIEGEDYTLTIKSIYTNPDGSTSTTAQYQDEGLTYTSTITQSPTATYINLATSKGLYEVEATNNTGYIYKTDTIRQQMQDTSTNDFTILPIPTKSPR